MKRDNVERPRERERERETEKERKRERKEKLTTGSFKRAKPPRLNRSQSSVVTDVARRFETGVNSDRQWGWYRGIASWHALCGPSNDARLLSPRWFVSWVRNDVLLRSLELSDDPCSVSSVHSSKRSRGNRFENTHIPRLLETIISMRAVRFPFSRPFHLSFSRSLVM